MPDIVPFERFLSQTAEARIEPYLDAMRGAPAGAALDLAAAAVEFQSMKDFILRFYKGVRPVGSFVDSAGRPVDCIPKDQHPAAQAALRAGLRLPEHAPPPPRIGGSLAAAPVVGKGSHPHAVSPCPKGAIPVPRITLERMARHGTFENFSRKDPAPQSESS